MSKHVTEWLNAYLDGELRSSQLQQVEAHLVECQACRDELESLARLSSLLHEVPAPQFSSSERFAAQVNLRLPHRSYPQASISRSRMFEVGWWLVPVGLLGAWVFMGTSLLVNGILETANNFGLLAGITDWLVFDPASETYWSATLGQYGILSGNTLDWAASTEALTRTLLPLLIFQVTIALLYLSWMAIWWARRRRQESGQLLEG